MNTFSGNTLKIKEGIIDLEKSVFSYLNDKDFQNIEILKLPSTLQGIEDNVLNNFLYLSKIEVSEDNEFYKSVDGVLYSKDGKRLIKYPPEKIGKFIVPEEVEVIEPVAFSLSLINEIEFSMNLKKIGYEAFWQCEWLKEINLPEGLIEIEEKAFYYCNFKNKVKLPKTLEILGSKAFSSLIDTSENDYFDIDENGILYSDNHIIDIINNDFEININGNFLIDAYSGENFKIVKINGNSYIEDSAFFDCEELIINGYPFIEKNAFNFEKLKLINVNGKVFKISENMLILNFLSFRNKYIIEYLDVRKRKSKNI